MFQLDAHMHVLSPNIQSLKNAAVVDLSCFHSTKYSLQEFLDVKNRVVIKSWGPGIFPRLLREWPPATFIGK